MARDVVAAFPGAADALAGCVCQNFSCVAHLCLFPVGLGGVAVNDLALAACESEAAIYERGAEKPLRDGRPDGGDEEISQCGFETARSEGWREPWAQRGMAEDEEEKRRRYPHPADFHKEDIEDV